MSEENIMYKRKEKLIDRIVVKEDEEKQRILKLQKANEKRLISEEEITEKDKEKLYNLYEYQIDQLKISIKKAEDEIEINKNEILKIRKQI